MKKLFSLLFVALLTMSAWADTTVTFTAGTDLGSTTQNGSADQVTKDGITIDCTDAAFATTQYRFYASSTATISSTVGTITSIEFTCSASGTSKYGPASFSTEEGTYSYEGKVGTWTGAATSVEISASAQVRATQIVVTVSGDPVATCAAPTLPASQNFSDTFTVEITNNEADATVSYSFDQTEWVTYENPFTINATTTVYAKAAKDGVESDVVNATYTKLESYTEGGTATFVALTDTVEGGSTAGWHEIVKDGVTMKFYGTVSNYQLTDSLGNVTSEFHEYRIHKNQSIEFTTTAGNIRKIEFTCSSSNPISGFGTVEGMTVDGDNGIWEGNTRDITFSTSVKQVRATQIVVTLDDQVPTVNAPAFTPASNTKFAGSQEVTITCDTEGAAVYYSYDGENYSEYTEALTITESCTIYAYAIKDGVQSEVVSAVYTKLPEVTTIAEANALDNKTDFAFTGNVIAVYQNGSNLWVKDETGYGLIYGNQVPTIAEGATIKAGWTAQSYLFRTVIHEYQYPTGVEATDAELVEIVPEERTALTTDNINERVIMKDLTLLADTANAKYLYNAADSLVIYNQFNIEYPTLEEGKTYDVEGMVSYYNNQVQIMPIAITEHVEEPSYLRGDVDMDGQVGIADVTALIDYILSKDATGISVQAADCDVDGQIGIADVTALIDYILSKTW